MAPRELNPEERKEWYQIVERLPANWFGAEVHAVLTNLCRHIYLARYFAERLGEVTHNLEGLETRLRKENPGITREELAEAVNMRIDRQKHYANMQLEQSKMIRALSTALRLTPQSRYDPITAKSATRDEERPKTQLWDS